MKAKLLFIVIGAITITGCGSNVESSSKTKEEISFLESQSEESNSNIISEEQFNFYEPNLNEYYREEVKYEKDRTKAYIEIDKHNFIQGDKININCFNYQEKDWVGVYPIQGEPGCGEAMYWVYCSAKLEIDTSLFPGNKEYKLYLCQNDEYVALDYETFSLENADMADYGVLSGSFANDIMNDISIALVRITPSSSNKLTYALYWTKDGKRIDNFTYIKRFSYQAKNKEEIEIFLPDGIFMPREANGIEIAVEEGHSSSYFIDIDNDSYKLEPSNYRYSFNVLTDLHIEDKLTTHQNHLYSALEDIYNFNKDSKALFTIGDHTNHGEENEYKLLSQIMETYTSKVDTNVYYALGNHEYIYAESYLPQVSLFKNYTNMDDVYYSLELEGSKVIYLGSDSIIGEGTINQEHIDWLKNQLETANQDYPIYLFLHQPLINTIAGSYEGQDWYGINTGEKIKEILKDYPNAFLFTGHTHWTLESNNNVKFGYGANCNYINCAAVGYMWNDNNQSEPGSEGYFVDVYDDYIVIKGREFVEKKWTPYAFYCIKINY